MKLLERPQAVPMYDGVYLSLKIHKSDVNAVLRLVEGLGDIDPEKEYDVIIKPHKRKRSLDSNSYLWVLLDKLAKVLRSTSEEVYRTYIHDYGVSEIVPIREAAIERWIQNWQSKGYGWICEDMGECRNTPGFHYIRTYYGSSTYTTDEMSRLLDAVIEDCKAQGIETLPPDEIEHLKELWKGGTI